jgi:hypothetical protein
MWVEAPLKESGSSGVIKDRMTNALYHVHTLDVPTWPNVKRENTAAGEVTCFSFRGILRPRSEDRILLRVRDDRRKEQRKCGAEMHKTLHRPNKNYANVRH